MENKHPFFFESFDNANEKISSNSVNSKPYKDFLRDFFPKHTTEFLVPHFEKRQYKKLYEWDNVFQAKRNFLMMDISIHLQSLFPKGCDEVQNLFNGRLKIKQMDWIFVENKYRLKNAKLNAKQIKEKITKFCDIHLQDPPARVHVWLLVGNDEVNVHSA